MDEGLLACYPTCESDMPAYTCSGNGHGQAAIMSVIDVGRLGPFGTSGNHSPPAGASVSSPSTSGSASMHSAGETLPVVFSELPGAAAASGSSARASASAAAPAAGGSSGTSEQPLPRASKAAGARARAAAAAQQRGRAAATAAIAHGEYTAAGKRRGRPPRENMAYSREYLAVKRYRERQRSMVRAGGCSGCAGKLKGGGGERGRQAFGRAGVVGFSDRRGRCACIGDRLNSCCGAATPEPNQT